MWIWLPHPFDLIAFISYSLSFSASALNFLKALNISTLIENKKKYLFLLKEFGWIEQYTYAWMKSRDFFPLIIVLFGKHYQAYFPS